MIMKKKLAAVICSLPFAFTSIAFAQTGGATEGTTSPQSGNQTDMGTDGTSNSNAGSGSSASSSGATGGDSTSSGAPSGSGSTGASGSGSAGSGASGSGSGAGSAGAAGGSSDSSSTTTPSTSGSPSSGASNASTQSTPSAASGESFDAKLKGKSVYNENDEKVGDVKDLVMSADGKVTHVILGVGGFVGVGEHPVAIPFDEINQTGDKLTLRGYTKDQLKEMPAYEYPREERAPASTPASTGGASPMGPR